MAGRADGSSDGADPEVVRILAKAKGRGGKLAAGVLAAVLGLVALGWAFWPHTDAADGWDTARAERGDLVQRVTAVGPIAAQHSVEVGSELSGRVAEVLVDANAVVEAGAVLARLDDTTPRQAVAQAEAQRAQAEAQRQQARAALALARHEREQAETLAAARALAPDDVRTATLQEQAQRAAVAAADAAVASAEATLARAEEELRKTEILAPIDGVVVRRLVDPGQMVVSALQSVPLFEIASDLMTLEAVVSVDEADVARVTVGQPATFTVTAWPDHVFSAVVTSVDLAPELDKRVVSYATELEVDNREGLLRPGLTATAEIEVGRLSDAVLVPAEALRFAPREGGFGPHDRPRHAGGDGPTVWQLVDGELVPVPVRVLGTDGVRAAVDGAVMLDRPVVLAGRGT
ncbi:MAG: efflux RND transporter periplasmic adaptor subunit [Alphaproteobacteria bacterium]|nr:efflux RND transporter periplasmic adaptor subunit [Alphaproteobacteria bacterium]